MRKAKSLRLNIILITLFLFISILIITHNVSALGYQSNTGVQFTINPTITLSVSGDLTINDLTPGNSNDSNIITVTTSSNAIAGYGLYSTVGSDSNGTSTGNPSTELRRNGTDTTNKFTSITTNKSSLSDFNGSDWGYSYCNGDNTICTNTSDNWVSGNTGSTLSGYNGLPLYDSSSNNNNNNGSNNTAGIKLVDTTTSGTTTISFKIGAKASNSQIAGDYTNTINFIGVAKANPPVYMQNFTNDMCSAYVSSDAIVTDARDGKEYAVRYINGNCWMVQNLAIAKGSVLTDELSNVDSSGYTIPTTDLTSGNSYENGRSHEGTTGKTGTGYWYNYCAASAGTVCSGTIKADALYDICPKGWRLPTYSEQLRAIKYKDAFNPVAGGLYNSGSPTRTDFGYWWSATASDTESQYLLRYYSDSLGTGLSYKQAGLYVRCLRSS